MNGSGNVKNVEKWGQERLFSLAIPVERIVLNPSTFANLQFLGPIGAKFYAFCENGTEMSATRKL